MKVQRVAIKNFRSIKELDFQPGSLCTLMGENNSGKSTIMRALNLVLGEIWPTDRSFDESDFHTGNTADPVVMQVYFDTPVQHLGRNNQQIAVHGFQLLCKCYKRKTGDKLPGDLAVEFTCLGPQGGRLTDQLGPYRPGGAPPPPLRVSNAMREQVPLLYVDVMREYSRQQPTSRWSVLRRLLDQIQLAFRNDKSQIAVLQDDGTTAKISRQEAFEYFMKKAHDVLRTQDLRDLEQRLEVNALEQMGLQSGSDGVSLGFSNYDPGNAYKSLELLVEQMGITSSASDVGAGLQSAIVVAIFRTYEELRRSGAIFAIEEPEAFLHPQKARYFGGVLEGIADAGNQVFLTTHSPFFVKLHRPESVAVVRRTAASGTIVAQASSVQLTPDLKAALRLQTSVNAARGEMLFARRILLVEGQTEAIAMPFVFETMGVDPNREGVSVIECGGKPAIPFYSNIARAFGIPFVVLADDDGTKAPAQTAAIRRICPPDRLFLMNPDFEGECGYAAGDKLVDAYKHFTQPSVKIPQVVSDAVTKLMQL